MGNFIDLLLLGVIRTQRSNNFRHVEQHRVHARVGRVAGEMVAGIVSIAALTVRGSRVKCCSRAYGENQRRV